MKTEGWRFDPRCFRCCVKQNTLGLSTTTPASFIYDGSGARIKKITADGTNTYVNKLFELRSDGSQVTHIFAGSDLICDLIKPASSPTQPTYIHGDHLGSVTLITDATGHLTEESVYTPFGETYSSDGDSPLTRKYTGQEFDDETGLYFYNARYYDPVLGRFVSADTVVPSAGDPQTFNRYAYVRNNPILMTDPDGHLFFVPAILIAMASYAAINGTVAALNGGNGAAIWTATWQGAIQGGAYAIGASIGGPVLGGALAGATGGLLNGGGTNAVIQGAVIGGVTAGVSSRIPIPQNPILSAMTRVGVGAVIGGSISSFTGGNFSEGATQGAMFAAVAIAYSGATNAALKNHYNKQINKIGNDHSLSFGERAEKIQEIYTKAGQMGLKLHDFRMVEVTENTQQFNRVWGGKGPEGSWITSENWTTSMEADQLNSLPPENLATNISLVTVEPGTRLIWGVSQPNFGKPGGGIEIYIENGKGVKYEPGKPLKR